jgi:hypothetical protein
VPGQQPGHLGDIVVPADKTGQGGHEAMRGARLEKPFSPHTPTLTRYCGPVR